MKEPMEDLVALMLLYSLTPSLPLMLLALLTILYPVFTVAGLIQTQHIPIIGVFHQYAHHGTGKTRQSVSQMRDFRTIIDNFPCSFDGKQRLETLESYIIPLSIRSG